MEKRLRVLADVLSGCPLRLPCEKLCEPGGWCMRHCLKNNLHDPDAECWMKYAEEVAKEAEQ